MVAIAAHDDERLGEALVFEFSGRADESAPPVIESQQSQLSSQPPAPLATQVDIVVPVRSSQQRRHVDPERGAQSPALALPTSRHRQMAAPVTLPQQADDDDDERDTSPIEFSGRAVETAPPVIERSRSDSPHRSTQRGRVTQRVATPAGIAVDSTHEHRLAQWRQRQLERPQPLPTDRLVLTYEQEAMATAPQTVQQQRWEAQQRANHAKQQKAFRSEQARRVQRASERVAAAAHAVSGQPARHFGPPRANAATGPPSLRQRRLAALSPGQQLQRQRQLEARAEMRGVMKAQRAVQHEALLAQHQAAKQLKAEMKAQRAAQPQASSRSPPPPPRFREPELSAAERTQQLWMEAAAKKAEREAQEHARLEEQQALMLRTAAKSAQRAADHAAFLEQQRALMKRKAELKEQKAAQHEALLAHHRALALQKAEAKAEAGEC